MKNTMMIFNENRQRYFYKLDNVLIIFFLKQKKFYFILTCIVNIFISLTLNLYSAVQNDERKISRKKIKNNNQTPAYNVTIKKKLFQTLYIQFTHVAAL